MDMRLNVDHQFSVCGYLYPYPVIHGGISACFIHKSPCFR
uniref:Uncharacterized protein n=1 Tax=Anguilla anguilla TaxID=7936 RepID=A0A0E9RNX3_ANGAN